MSFNNSYWSSYVHYEMYIFTCMNAFIYGLLFSIIGSSLSNSIWRKATTILILFHSFFLCTQVFSWYILGFDFDLGPMLGGSPHRAMFYSLYRPTGVYAEPSIYAGYMVVFLSLRYLKEGKADYIFLLGLVSLAVTLSTVALILLILIVCIIYIKYSIKSLIASGILLFTTISLTYVHLVSRLQLFLSGNDGSNNAKFYIIEQWISENWYLFNGLNIVTKSKFDGTMAALGDLTFFVNMPVIFGLFIGLFFSFSMLIIIYSINADKRAKLLVLASLIKFSSLAHPFFWFYIYAIQQKNIKGKNNEID